MSGPGLMYEGLTKSTSKGPRWRGILRTVEDAVDLPLHWKKPKRIFVNSMSDLFHEGAPLEFLLRVFETMRRAHWHTFQILTKRSERLRELATQLPWPENVWMGVSVENADYVDRIDDLRTTGAHVKFLSLEPLLGPLKKLKLKNIDWVIVGGESGHRARPMDPAWVTDIRDQCAKAGVAFFFKQWGGKNKKKAGRVLEGKTYDAMPETAPTVPVARVSRAAGRSLAVVG